MCDRLDRQKKANYGNGRNGEVRDLNGRGRLKQGKRFVMMTWVRFFVDLQKNDSDRWS